MLKLLLGLLLAVHVQPPIAPEPARFHEGQVWEYRTLPGDEGSLLKIQRVEAWPGGGHVYHISITGVRLGPFRTALAHLPVSRETLDASVTRLSRSRAHFPSADEGIAVWREARGGIFTIPLADIMGAMGAELERTVHRDPGG